jgi:P-type E1-E2 ATPase
VADVVSALPEMDPRALLRLAAGAEGRSEHPLGKAIAAAVADAPVASAFKMEPGKGVGAVVEGVRLALGTPSWIRSRGVSMTAEDERRIEAARMEGQAVVAIEADGRFAGWIALSDTLREDAAAIIAELRLRGIGKMLLLTGDHAAAAGKMAAAAGIDIVESNLLPEDKVSLVMSHVDASTAISMVGDGVNDAAALKSATVGIAMGGMGSDIAVEAADIVLMRDDIRMLPYLVTMSRRTLANIRVNIAASLLINGVAIALAARGDLGPALGALVHNAGSLFVVGHAALLLRCRPDAEALQARSEG